MGKKLLHLHCLESMRHAVLMHSNMTVFEA